MAADLSSCMPDPHDLLDLAALLSGEERMVREAVRSFVADRIEPEVGHRWEEGFLPKQLAGELASVGAFGESLTEQAAFA